MNHAVTRPLPLWWLGLVSAALPLVCMHITYVVSALQGHVEWCVPYWDSCTSISRTGRYGASYFIFKGLMIPAAVLGIGLWWLHALWLQQVAPQARKLNWLVWLGTLAGLSLLLYTLALGHAGQAFQVMRRAGVVIYFAFTFLNQLILSAALESVHAWHSTGKAMLRWCQMVLAIGILSVLLSALDYELYKATDDAFEWTLALLLNIHALWSVWLWRSSGFSAGVQLDMRV